MLLEANCSYLGDLKSEHGNDDQALGAFILSSNWSRRLPTIASTYIKQPATLHLLVRIENEEHSIDLAHNENMAVTEGRTVSAQEEAAWLAPSQGMAYFHNSHKRTFNRSYTHAYDYAEQGQSLKSFLRESYNLVIHLGNHHRIEESYIFPLLARKHPAFRNDAEHKSSHKAIHDGLERYSSFLRNAMADESMYSPAKLREILDSFREPLMRHLDDEIRDLQPDSLKAHGFTLTDVRALPF